MSEKCNFPPDKYKFTIQIIEHVPRGNVQAWEAQIRYGQSQQGGWLNVCLYGDTEDEVVQAAQAFCNTKAEAWRESARKQAALKPPRRYEITL